MSTRPKTATEFAFPIGETDEAPCHTAHTEVLFSVGGTVKTNERHRHGKGRAWTPTRTKLARREVVEAFRAEAVGWSPWEGPVEMDVHCYHLMPKSGWPGKQCNKKPDLDNVIKLVGDALNGVAYRDDAQIRQVTATKAYAEEAGIRVRLRFLEVPVKPRHGRVKFCDGLYGFFHWGNYLGAVLKQKNGYLHVTHGRPPEPYEYEAIKAGSIYTDCKVWPTLDAAEAAVRKAASDGE